MGKKDEAWLNSTGIHPKSNQLKDSTYSALKQIIPDSDRGLSISNLLLASTGAGIGLTFLNHKL